MSYMIFNGESVRDISADLLDATGRLKIMPAAYYASTTNLERCMFCVKNAVYGLHTEELVGYLRAMVGKCSAIEIGAGNGVLCEALKIRGVDNYMQEVPEIKRIYDLTSQATIRYGTNVEKMDGIAAIKKYKPQVVIGSWITHKFRQNNPSAGGNQFAPDELEILKHCELYIMIGNTSAHAMHPLMKMKHDYSEPLWLYSRGFPGSKNFIGVWKGKK